MSQKKHKSRPQQWSMINNLEVAMASGKYIGEILIQPCKTCNKIRKVIGKPLIHPVNVVYVGNPDAKIRKLFGLPEKGPFDRHKRRTVDESVHIRR